MSSSSKKPFKMKLASSGAVTKFNPTTEELHLAALDNVVNHTPKAGDLSKFEAPKEPVESASEYAITLTTEEKAEALIVLEEGSTELSKNFTAKLAQIDQDAINYENAKSEHKEIQEKNAELEAEHSKALAEYNTEQQKTNSRAKKKQNRPDANEEEKPAAPTLYAEPDLEEIRPEFTRQDVLDALDTKAKAAYDADPFNPAEAKRSCEAYLSAIFQFVTRESSEKVMSENQHKLSHPLSHMENVRTKLNEIGMRHEADDMVGKAFELLENQSEELDDFIKIMSAQYANEECIPNEAIYKYITWLTKHAPEKNIKDIPSARDEYAAAITSLFSKDHPDNFSSTERAMKYISVQAKGADGHNKIFLENLLRAGNDVALEKFVSAIKTCITYRAVMTAVEDASLVLVNQMAADQTLAAKGTAQRATFDIPSGTGGYMEKKKMTNLGFTLQEDSMVLIVKDKASGTTFAYHVDSSNSEESIHSGLYSFLKGLYPSGNMNFENDISELFDVTIVGGNYSLEDCKEAIALIGTLNEKGEQPDYHTMNKIGLYQNFQSIMSVCRENGLAITATNIFDKSMPKSFCYTCKSHDPDVEFNKRAADLPRYRRIPSNGKNPSDSQSYLNKFIHINSDRERVATISVDGRESGAPKHNPYIATSTLISDLDQIKAMGTTAYIGRLRSALPGAPSIVIANIIHESNALDELVTGIRKEVLLTGQLNLTVESISKGNILYSSTMPNSGLVAQKPAIAKVSASNSNAPKASLFSSLLGGNSQKPPSAGAAAGLIAQPAKPQAANKPDPKAIAERNNAILKETHEAILPAWGSLYHRAEFALPIISGRDAEKNRYSRGLREMVKPLEDAARVGVSVKIKNDAEGNPVYRNGLLIKRDLTEEEQIEFPSLKDGYEPDPRAQQAISQKIIENAASKYSFTAKHQAALEGMARSHAGT